MSAARGDQPRHPILRTAYQPPAWWIDHIRLEFELDQKATRVISHLQLRRNAGVEPQPLVLTGSDLDTQRVEVQGQAVPWVEKDGELIIEDLPDSVELTTEVIIDPSANTALEGLYRSGAMLLSQCEAEGFRKITWFLDRPDVMARYQVRLSGSRQDFPILLSNGNCVEAGELDGGRHFAVWEDPFPKPSYLFAIVAGDLAELRDEFTTASGRKVAIKFYSELENVDRLPYAVDSLKRAMAWDEARFGLEYDLDIYHVVATHDFNMGAMENKSLNIFNARYVLADQNTATDADHAGIERVIGHEYFHNWTGNRVTCRDWFQLTLKEGLTVYRDQEFSADQRSRGVQRIQDVATLMARQFPEDAGPMAHPVRPERYVEINNFYTTTIYEKGAEVVRMYETLLGREGFRRGLDLYFQRHDGQAVTCDDFRRAMADANEANLDQFENWYRQVGTPVLEAQFRRDEHSGDWLLGLRQRLPEHADNSGLGPLMIPVRIGLLDENNHSLPVTLAGEDHPGPTTRLLVLDTAEAEYRLTGLPPSVLPSLLRGFSAPVHLEFVQSPQELARLAAHDPDPYSRWQAMRRLTQVVMADLLMQGESPHEEALTQALATVLEGSSQDQALSAELLTLPTTAELVEAGRTPVEVDAIHAARSGLMVRLGRRLEGALKHSFDELAPQTAWSPDGADAARRQLRNQLLKLMAEAGLQEVGALAEAHYTGADNMTDRLAALQVLVHHDLPAAGQALEDFEQRHGKDALIMDKWFAVQATRPHVQAVEQVAALMEHPAFRLDNPNKVRALIGALALNNPVAFHRLDGAGHALVGSVLARLDALNPQTAARLAGCFSRWRRYEQQRADSMRSQLEKLTARAGISVDLEEVVRIALGSAQNSQGH